MKRWYKILIICGASLVLLLCSVVGVSAKSIEVKNLNFNMSVHVVNSWFGTPFNFEYSSLDETGEYLQYTTTGNQGIPAGLTYAGVLETFKITSIDGECLIPKGGNTNVGLYNVYQNVGVNHPDGFYYSNYIYLEHILICYMNGECDYVDITTAKFNQEHGIYDLEFSFEPSGNVQYIEVKTQIDVQLKSALTSPLQITVYGGQPTEKVQLTVSQSSEEAGLLGEINNSIQDGTDQITGEIQESTDQITNGWTPNPEKPAGSESVDDMTDIEQEIMDGSQEGIDSGNQVLSNFGGFLENWREGFIFVIGLFNILFANTWINSLIQIGLALGLIAFILNIAPSIARKISSGKKGGAK